MAVKKYSEKCFESAKEAEAYATVHVDRGHPVSLSNTPDGQTLVRVWQYRTAG